jgi:hypothetical protein
METEANGAEQGTRDRVNGTWRGTGKPLDGLFRRRRSGVRWRLDGTGWNRPVEWLKNLAVTGLRVFSKIIIGVSPY